MFSSDNAECRQRLSGGHHEPALKNDVSLIIGLEINQWNDKSRARQQMKHHQIRWKHHNTVY